MLEVIAIIVNIFVSFLRKYYSIQYFLIVDAIHCIWKHESHSVAYAPGLSTPTPGIVIFQVFTSMLFLPN